MDEKTGAAVRERLVTVAGVSKSYAHGDKQFAALRDVDLQVFDGELVALLGPSGCGKSTLLRLVTGLDRPTSGQVLYRDRPLAGVNARATIVFQTFALYPWLTVQGNVEVALRARGVDGPERRERALRVIDMVGLDGFETAFPRELSGGMRQKVGFARALAVEPELLCLDEPFSALDVLSAEALRRELMTLWLGRSTPTRAALMVTHNIEEALLMADRIVVMGKDPGHVVTEIPIALAHPRARKDTAFLALMDRVYTAVAGRTREEPERPAADRRRERLPVARLNQLAGLLEKLESEGGRADLYRLANDLSLALDDLLPIVEAAERIGFARVQGGDLWLTALGRSYASADVLTRKELVAGRILRLPTVRWIFETLEGDDDQRVDRGHFLDELRRDFGDHAEQQLETAVGWGRFAELFGYDDSRNEVYLETEDAAAGAEPGASA